MESRFFKSPSRQREWRLEVGRGLTLLVNVRLGESSGRHESDEGSELGEVHDEAGLWLRDAKWMGWEWVQTAQDWSPSYIWLRSDFGSSGKACAVRML